MTEPTPVKLLSILDCARPVLFSNDMREYPFSFGGSAFIVTCQERTFVITARHVLDQGGFTPQQFCIQCRPDGNEFLPLGALYRVNGSESEDTDQYDIVVCDVAPISDAAYGRYRPYSLDTSDYATIYSEASSYLYKGYPSAMRKPDYEGRTFEQGAVSTQAKYAGTSEFSSIRKLHLGKLDPLTSIDGLSGSPVFQVNNLKGTRYSTEAFAGMLIRGSVESGVAYFVEHKRIIQVLLSILSGNVTSTN